MRLQGSKQATRVILNFSLLLRAALGCLFDQDVAAGLKKQELVVCRFHAPIWRLRLRWFSR
ncbi:hypothetical protein [Synechococcus sp. MIT S1220]|uniref:hypothetical protein n=1 Tax=Synechococcus sp. MIT S1220 TaxID=3082549 RepID=UPI0039AFA8E8